MLDFLKRTNGKVINVNDIDNLVGKIELIDIREPYEYTGGSIKGAKNIPMGELLGNTDRYLDKRKEYYIMCQSGGRSTRVCSTLASEGYDVINVSGGMGSYVGTKRS